VTPPPPGECPSRWLRMLNLLWPGAGLSVAGHTGLGLLLGLLFAVCADFAILTILIVPDDFSRTAQTAAIGLAAATYVGAQIGWRHGLRAARAHGADADRRRILEQTQQALARGDAAQALAAIQPLADRMAQDLLVAYRLAQALSPIGDAPRARIAWQRVRQLDRHGLYRAEIRQAEQVAAREGADQH